VSHRVPLARKGLALICFVAFSFGSLVLPGSECAAQNRSGPAEEVRAEQKSLLHALQDAFVSVAERVEPAVVTITTRKITRARFDRSEEQEEGIPSIPFGRSGLPRAFRSEGIGSGVIISADGWVLTNDHVVGGADRVTVRLHDGREFNGTVRRDYRSDLALVKIEGSGFPTARLGDSDRVKVGQWAIAIGSPFRYANSFSVGVISSLSRRQEILDRGAGSLRLYPSMIQTDAAINPGNSGGPLVNLDGEIIGINTAIETENGGSIGIGFAIPINSAKFVIEQLRSQGKVRYGYLGIDPSTVTPRLASSYKVTGGALVQQEPDPDSPAGKAGIRVEDVIIAINDKQIYSETDLRLTISRIAPGTTVKITLVRNGEQRVVSAQLGEAPAILPPAPPAPVKPSLGIEVVALTPEAAERAGLPRAEGVVIKSLEPGSSATETDLQRGDIILQVNGVPTPNLAAFQRMTANLKSGDVVRILSHSRRGSSYVKRVAIVTVD
jgi:serine protease Do